MLRYIKRLGVNVALLSLSLMLVLGLCEVALRVVSSQLTEKRQHNRLFVEYDSLLGWRKIPGKKGKFVTEEYEIVESFNSKGIRGPEYSYEKEGGEYRILVLGDSFAEGYSVEFDDLFSEVLKNRLNENADFYYQVINTGTGGYSTDQELLFFQHEGKKYHPDLTVLLFCINDVLVNTRDTYWRGNKPLFKLEEETLRLTNVPVPRDTTSVQTTPVALAVRGSIFAQIKDGLKTNLYL